MDIFWALKYLNGIKSRPGTFLCSDLFGFSLLLIFTKFSFVFEQLLGYQNSLKIINVPKMLKNRSYELLSATSSAFMKIEVESKLILIIYIDFRPITKLFNFFIMRNENEEKSFRTQKVGDALNFFSSCKRWKKLCFPKRCNWNWYLNCGTKKAVWWKVTFQTFSKTPKITQQD